jgi:hypothetical protein
MIKVVLKPLKHALRSPFTDLFIEYGQFVNVAIVLWFSRDLSLDLVGTILVAVTSFSCYTLTLSNDLIQKSFYCFVNQLAVQTKSLLVVFSYLGAMFGQLSLLCHFVFLTFSLFILLHYNSRFYFTGKTLAGILLGVFCFEYYTDFYVLSHNIFVLILSFFLIFYTYPLFSLTENETMLIPLALDVAAVIYFIPSLEIKISLGVISYVMVVAIYLKPMYYHNTVLLYMLSFVQTYILCKLQY